MEKYDKEILNIAGDIIESIETEYYALCKKYAKLKGNVLDGGYWREINAIEMTTEDCERLIQVTNDAKWLDNNLGTSIIYKDVYFKE